MSSIGPEDGVHAEKKRFTAEVGFGDEYLT